MLPTSHILKLKNSWIKKYFITLSFILSLSTVYTSTIAQNTSFDWKSLYRNAYFDGFRNLPPLREHWLELSKSNRLTDLQGLSYGLDGIISMFETTDSLVYLNDAITIINNVIQRAQVTRDIPGDKFRFKDKYKGWAGEDLHSGLYGLESPLTEGYFFEYASRVLKIIHDSRPLAYYKKYKEFYDSTLNFIQTDIWDKWESRGTRFGIKYVYLLMGTPDMAAHWADIAANLSFLTNDLEKKEDYLQVVQLFNNNLEDNFIKYDKYISWSDKGWVNNNWNGSKLTNRMDGVQDVAHANHIISYIVDAYSLGLWTDTDAIKRIIATVKDKLWDIANCSFKDNMDGTMFSRDSAAKWAGGSFQPDFAKLACYDSTLFTIYERFVSCSPLLTRWYQYGGLFANLALSKKTYAKYHL